MTGSLTVTGGADGITANLEDLRAFSQLMLSGAESVGDAIHGLGAPALRWVLELGAKRDPCGAQGLQDELSALLSPAGQLHAAQERMRTLSRLLWAAISSYHGAEDTVLSSVTHAVGHAAAGFARIAGGDYGGGGREMFSALPGLADAAMSSGGWLDGPLAEVVPDGHPVLHDMGDDPWDFLRSPPRDLADLLSELAFRNGGRAGEVSVCLVRGADGARRAIVDIPGTKSWNPVPNHDITSVGTDASALDGRETAYEDGVFMALDAAGVGRQDEVMLVGHSEGGIVAVNAARHAGSRFRITHVVTAGSPIGRLVGRVPGTVQVLALENAADLVPHLDGAVNPDRPNVTTVTVDDQRGSVGADHDLMDTYQPAAAAADRSHNASVDSFVRTARGFLSGDAIRTHAYRITRAF